jgi:DNA-binding phage protein
MAIETPDKIDYQLADLETVSSHMGGHIRAHRKSQGLSSEALATKAGISRKTLYQLETSGVAEFMTVLRVLRALGLLSRLEFLEYKEEVSPMDYPITGKRRK